MEKINWKIFAPLLLVVLVVYMVWLDHWSKTGQMLNGLGRGKGKKQPPSPPQYTIDFNPKNEILEDAPSKIQLLTQSINYREKQLNHLKEARKAKSDQVRNAFAQKAIDAQNKARQKETFLINNYNELGTGRRKTFM